MVRRLVMVVAIAACAFTSIAQKVDSWIMKVGNVQAFAASDGEINAIGTREEILADPRVTVVANGASLVVRQYTVSLKQTDGELLGPFAVTGAALPTKFLALLESRHEGTVYIESIKVNTADGQLRTVRPITMKMTVKK